MGCILNGTHLGFLSPLSVESGYLSLLGDGNGTTDKHEWRKSTQIRNQAYANSRYTQRREVRLSVVTRSKCSSRPILGQILKREITEDFSLGGRKLVRLTKRILIVKCIEITKSG